MKVIGLSETQKVGAAALYGELQKAHGNLDQFLKMALAENGGDVTQPWRFNQTKVQWELNDDSGTKSE